MKPTKNRVFCRDCSRHKMLFETEKKALTFMKFNNDEIEQENGYAPQRAYFCQFCGGWHVSSIGAFNGKSKNEEKLAVYLTENRAEAYAIQKDKLLVYINCLPAENRSAYIIDQIKTLRQNIQDGLLNDKDLKSMRQKEHILNEIKKRFNVKMPQVNIEQQMDEIELSGKYKDWDLESLEAEIADCKRIEQNFEGSKNELKDLREKMYYMYLNRKILKKSLKINPEPMGIAALSDWKDWAKNKGYEVD